MGIGLIFWIVMLVWLIFGVWRGYTVGGDHFTLGGTLMEFVLFLLLGWGVFGPPIHG